MYQYQYMRTVTLSTLNTEMHTCTHTHVSLLTPMCVTLSKHIHMYVRVSM